MKEIIKELHTQDNWQIIKTKYVEKEAVTDGSNFMIGNGYLGYRGTFAEDKKEQYQGCFVTDTWDKADGKWEELCNVPNALFLAIKDFSIMSNRVSYKRILDVNHAITKRYVEFKKEDAHITLIEEKFASYAKKNVVAMKYTLTSNMDITLDMIFGIDTDVWNLNGTHLENFKLDRISPSTRIVSSETTEKKDVVCVGELVKGLVNSENEQVSETLVHLKKDTPYIIEKYMVVASSNDVQSPYDYIKKIIDSIQSYEEEKKSHSAVWDLLWNDFDIQIEDNDIAQIGYRFNTYHSIIATPVHSSLPIGARGLSCQAYQGSAFWDQEVYNLPMYLYTNPTYARHILEYRYNTLDGARRKAQKHGYEGAFYAWISGKTGDELCPDFFFKDVLTNRKIRNHFNLWQIHISPDIAMTVKRYYDATQDEVFMHGMGIEMVFEIARFLASRVDYKPRKDLYEIRQVQGPDEYHENVDNNAFTNYQTKFTFEQALNYLSKFDSSVIESVKHKINLSNDEIQLWKDINKKLFIPPLNDNLVLEQFDGYFNLESVVPASDLTKRLLDPEEYYGWPNGIAVFTQCLKQSDVLQLIHLYPHLFEQDVIKANYRYYEPRTLHFSSLSPSIHQIIACKIKDEEKAEYYFNKAISIDLMNTNEAVSGGTFIGGMHTASNGAVWQMMVFGFGGFSYENEILYFEPFLIKSIPSITFNLHIQDQELYVQITHRNISITNHTNTKVLQVCIQGKHHSLSSRLELNIKE